MKIENAKFVILIENKYVELAGCPIPILYVIEVLEVSSIYHETSGGETVWKNLPKKYDITKM